MVKKIAKKARACKNLCSYRYNKFDVAKSAMSKSKKPHHALGAPCKACVVVDANGKPASIYCAAHLQRVNGCTYDDVRRCGYVGKKVISTKKGVERFKDFRCTRCAVKGTDRCKQHSAASIEKRLKTKEDTLKKHEMIKRLKHEATAIREKTHEVAVKETVAAVKKEIERKPEATPTLPEPKTSLLGTLASIVTLF